MKVKVIGIQTLFEMYLKFCLCFIFCILVVSCIEAKKEKNPNEKDKEKGKPSVQQSDVKPQYINQFSDSLRFLGSFFKIIQRQLNDTITGFNPNRPNPLFSALLSNPSLIPFALRRLREPLNEMITITHRIENILSNSDPTKLEDNNEVQRLLQQLQKRLQTLFGPLMPHQGLITRIPTNFPAAIESFSNWVSQMASMLAIFSQSVRDLTTPTTSASSSTPSQIVDPMSLFNDSRSAVPPDVDTVCTQLHSLNNVLSKINSRNITEKQNEGFAGSISDTVVTALASVLGYVENAMRGLFNAFSGAAEGFQNGFVGGGGTFRNSTLLLPLRIRNGEDYQQFTFGVIDPQNKLVIANILTKDQVHSQDSIGNETILMSRMSLNSVHSLMTSLVNDLQDIGEPRVLFSLKCQLEGFDCSVRNRDDYSVFQTCLKALSTCIGTGL